MSEIKQKIGMFLILTLLLAAGWHLSSLHPNLSHKAQGLESAIDVAVTELSIRQFSAQGTLINELHTPLMTHWSKEDIHLFTSPHLFLTEGEQPAWEIRATEAKSFDGGKRILFTNKVWVHQQAGQNVSESTFKTEELTYYPHEKKATSQHLVTFEQPGQLVQAKGMNAYLDEKRVELLHAARGRYEPAKG